MTAAEITRFTVLLEEISGNVKVLAEGQVAIVQRLDRVEERLDNLEHRMDRLEVKFDLFATDTGFRLDRIESHVGFDGKPTSRPRRRKPKS